MATLPLLRLATSPRPSPTSPPKPSTTPTDPSKQWKKSFRGKISVFGPLGCNCREFKFGRGMNCLLKMFFLIELKKFFCQYDKNRKKSAQAEIFAKNDLEIISI